MKEQYDLVEYVDRLYSAALKKTHDACVAEDIAQETFLTAVRQLAGGKRPDNLWAWLLAILSNKYCDWLREKYNRPQVSFETCSFEIAQEEAPDDDSEEKLEVIRRELGYLSRIHREVMIRFYMHGHTLERIAADLQIPVGTVKSRLNMGRQHVRKGVTDMENYTRQSYEPDTLCIACSGQEGLQHEPFSLVPPSDQLAQSILILAWPRPLTEAELARAVGVPMAFVEPVVERLTAGELMKRTEGGKVYTDFILYNDQDRKATFERQLAVADAHFLLFWEETAKALEELRQRPYWLRQSGRARSKLELYFCIKILMNAEVSVRDEIAGYMPFSEYPYRKDGGRWIASGSQYSAECRHETDAALWKYSVNGEVVFKENRFRDTKELELREYDTVFGRCPNYNNTSHYVKWFCELWEKVPAEESAVSAHAMQDTDGLLENGFLKQGTEGELELDLPVVSREEWGNLCRLACDYAVKVCDRIHDVLLPLFESSHVRLPAHLKSVPKWQQYMFCGESVPMAVLHKAVEEGLFLKEVDYPAPAALLIFEKDSCKGSYLEV